jgi:hypothetical protein
VSLQLEAEAEVPPRTADIPHRRKVRIASLVSAILACGVVGLATSPPAPGITGDSFFYLASAHSLVADQTLRYPDWRWTAADSVQPMIRTTPGLSLALGGLMSLGASPMNAARIVQSVSAAVTVGLSTFMVGVLFGPVVGFLAGLSILALPPFHDVHVYVLTEPLFLAATACALWALSVRKNAALAGAFFLVAAVTRYVGVSLAVGAGLAAFFSVGSLRTKAVRFAKVAGPSLAFFAGWRLWTATPNDPQSIRVRGLFPLDDELAQALSSAEAWLVPGSRPVLRLLLVGAIGACVLALIFARRNRVAGASGPSLASMRQVENGAATPARITALTIVLMMLCYSAFSLLSRLLAEPSIEFRDRMLLPIYVLTQLLIAVTLPNRIRRSQRARAFAALALGLWMILSMRVAFARVMAHRTIGLQIASKEVRASPTLRWLSNNARGRPVFSNNPLPIYHHAHRSAKFWPEKMLPDSAQGLVQRLRATDGLVVAFRRPDPWVPVASLDQLSSAIPLEQVATFSDGTVFALNGARRDGLR